MITGRKLLTMFTASSIGLVACSREPRPDELQEFVVTIENLAPPLSLWSSSPFEVPVGHIQPALLAPKQRYEFEVEVAPGARFQLVSMFAESNDAFVSFVPGGIPLWTEDGEVLDGDRSDELLLWDAGTEFNEVPGVGVTQLPRQVAPGIGAAEDGVVTRIVSAGEVSGVGPNGHKFPAPDRFAAVEIEHVEAWLFRVTLTNVSPPDLLPVPISLDRPARLSPGVYAVFEPGYQLFEEGEPASIELESLVEDGDPAALADQLFDTRGVASELSSVVWAVHEGDLRLYVLDEPAGPSLERLAEDADPELLVEELDERAASDASALGEYGVAAPEAGARLGPGEELTILVRARPGDHFSFVSAYLAANDKFFGVGQAGLELFDAEGNPRSGDQSWTLELLDAGTEIDELPGIGPNQFARQPEPGAGVEEHGEVRKIFGLWMGWQYPSADELVRVRLEPVAGGTDED
jgi:hypothetical protein